MKGAHLSLYLRQRIIELSKIYARLSDVSRAFRRENPGRRTRKRTIARIIKKYRENGIICDLKKSGRPSRWQLAHLDFIDEQLELKGKKTNIAKKYPTNVQKLILGVLRLQ